MESYKSLLIGRQLDEIYNNFGAFWHELVHEPQLRWVNMEAWMYTTCYNKRVVDLLVYILTLNHIVAVGARERTDASRYGGHHECTVGPVGQDGRQGTYFVHMLKSSHI